MLKGVPIWVFIVGVLILAMGLFGKFEASVGNVSIGGQDLGGGSVSFGGGFEPQPSNANPR